jgi:two-component system sensor histidine kinase KdpD
MLHVSNQALPSQARRPAWPGAWAAGVLAWSLGWLVIYLLDGRIDLANQALLLVLAGVVAALWLPPAAALASGGLAVVAFNWWLVPPRGSLAVDGAQNGLLLAAMLLVNSLVAVLMARLRRQAAQAVYHQQQAEQLRALGESLRDATEPLAHAGALQAALATLVGAPAALLLCRSRPGPAPLQDTPDTVMALGSADADERAGLWLCLQQGQAMGPGTGHHGSLAHWYLPLRGGGPAPDPSTTGTPPGALGAAVLRLPAAGRADDALRTHAQALCDQMGVALQRQFSRQAELAALGQAQLQAVRNALLAAISHDYRTPLATILGAASSLQDQGERLAPAQRLRLAQRIVQEAEHLGRLTDNTLQLARLDAPGVALRLDWESAEELVGTVLRRARQRAPARHLRARLEPGLPLLHCDAMLLTQLLDNLVDNALNHTPPDSPIEILVRLDTPRPAGISAAAVERVQAPTRVVLAVRDRGPGVAPAWRERIFEVFQRGDLGTPPGLPPADAGGRRGAGVGLAVCRAIARAHGGEMRLRARAHGGASFECVLPLDEPPAAPP